MSDFLFVIIDLSQTDTLKPSAIREVVVSEATKTQRFVALTREQIPDSTFESMAKDHGSDLDVGYEVFLLAESTACDTSTELLNPWAGDWEATKPVIVDFVQSVMAWAELLLSKLRIIGIEFLFEDGSDPDISPEYVHSNDVVDWVKHSLEANDWMPSKWFVVLR